MDDKRAAGRSKRPTKPPEDGSWDCSVCTYKNSAEAYKCEMCDVRKGTSTRKPRLNQQLVAQQVAQQYAAPLSPTPGSPLPDDESDPLFPDPNPPPVTEEESFEPPHRLPKQVIKKEKAGVIKAEKPVVIPPPPLTTTKSAVLPKQNKQIKKKIRPPRVKHGDQVNSHQMAVTVDNVTVVITDYPKKRRKISSDKNNLQSDTSDTSSNASYDITEERTANEGNT